MYKYRIGIIGTENTHSHQFITLFNKPQENGEMLYPDCHVTLVYGHYPEENKKAVEELGADKVAESIEEMVENVDAVMITARDGKFHYEFVKPFIEKGIPAFVDKPFTVDPKEAVALIKLAKEKNVPLCGGSSLKFAEDLNVLKDFIAEKEGKLNGGSVIAPVILNSEYSGIFFYAPHLTEMTLEIFGYNPKSILASENNNSLCAVVSYDGFDVSNHFNDGAPFYSASVYTKGGICHKDIDLSNCGKLECENFVEMLRTGKMAHSYKELAMPVFYMDALKKSYETGKRVTIGFEI